MVASSVLRLGSIRDSRSMSSIARRQFVSAAATTSGTGPGTNRSFANSSRATDMTSAISFRVRGGVPRTISPRVDVGNNAPSRLEVRIDRPRPHREMCSLGRRQSLSPHSSALDVGPGLLPIEPFPKIADSRSARCHSFFLARSSRAQNEVIFGIGANQPSNIPRLGLQHLRFSFGHSSTS